MIYCSIYKIKNSVNNKVYIGQSWRPIKIRWLVHLQPSRANHCVKLRRAIAKYGKEKFSIELLTICNTQETANYWEKFFISKYNSIKSGFNTLEGGGFSRLGTKHSSKTKKRMSDSRKGIGNSNSVLTLLQVNNIRIEYTNFVNPKTGTKYGAITMISKKYNVGTTTIFEIVKGQAW